MAKKIVESAETAIKMEKTVKSIENSIKGQERINTAAAATIETGINNVVKENANAAQAIEAGARKVQADIREQGRENADFVTAFYGYGKEE